MSHYPCDHQIHVDRDPGGWDRYIKAIQLTNAATSMSCTRTSGSVSFVVAQLARIVILDRR